MYIVTNKTKAAVTRGAIKFKPGENKFKDNELSAAKRAQILSDTRLKLVEVQDTPKSDSQETK